MKVAYIVSRFPKLTETFILYEILAMEKQGVQVSIYPLLKARRTSVHPEGATLVRKFVELFSRPQGTLKMHEEAVPLVERAHYQPFISRQILAAQFYYLTRKPLAYLRALGRVMWETWGSPNYFAGAVAVFPKTVYFSRLMEREGVDHIHAHFANHPAAAAFIVHRLTGIPYSFTAHGADLQVDQHMLCKKVEEAKAVITISKYNLDFIAEKCGNAVHDKIHVVYCGVDTQAFQPRPSRHKPQSAEPFHIVCIGTMYEVKGHTYLIEACRILQEKGLNFLCHLVGDGPFKETLAEQVSRDALEERVCFHGQLNRKEVMQLLQKADVLAVPSIPTKEGRREGIPVVLMEAMGSGVPVVASGISGIPELVEDKVSGILVPPRQPQALADAIEALYLDSDLWQRLAQGGRDRINSQFDLNLNAGVLRELFTSEELS